MDASGRRDFDGMWVPPQSQYGAPGIPPQRGRAESVRVGRRSDLQRRPPRRGGPLRALLLILVVVGALFVGYAARSGRLATLVHENSPGSIAVTTTERQPDAAPIDPAAVGALVAPALVDITVTDQSLGVEGAGTGILLTSDGQVLTSQHVIKGANKISVTAVSNGATYDATTLGYDSGHDVALIKLSGAQGLPVARLGDSDAVMPGDQLVAVGNAGGVGGAPSSVGGPVTDLNATIIARNEADMSRKNLAGLIEVQANVVPGQSGGSLVNRSGQVVGLITAASGPMVSAPKDKHGYAIPIKQALGIVDQIRRGVPTDDVHIGPTATLGVMISDQSGTATTARGVHVDMVVFDSPAESAGLENGDVITAIDGRPIDSVKALRAIINRHRPHDVIALNWSDESGHPHTGNVELADGPPN
ncbi:PDZ domain-containing protein [Skermania sp. ID1734]|uniref:S1C family serine protease n=1 Tax=Skermania sp. ID1734 TaxID=2597516 RepID=UPI00117D393C|nr:trypsin-like peptidase domain-containing protein [Skermania sp. ID1734]TSD99463.1 PDZ domain-containing protein [Skermania sp. ID1734]